MKRFMGVAAAMAAFCVGAGAQGQVHILHGSDPAKWRLNLPAGQVLRNARTAMHGPKGSSAEGAPLEYATFLGGQGEDRATAVTTDGQGNIYIVGTSWSRDFPVASDASDGSLGGRVDVYVAKFNSAGGLIYCTYLGGSNDEQATAVAADQYGNAYVGGQTSSLDFPTTPGAFLESSSGVRVSSAGPAKFVAKLNSAGNALLYSTLLGGGGSGDAVRAIAADKAGNLWVTGTNNSPDFTATAGAMTPSPYIVGGFLAKLNPAGTQATYVTALSAAEDQPAALAIDAAGNAYVAGSTTSLSRRGPGVQALNGGRTFFKTTDGGAHWAQLGAGLENMAITQAAVDPKDSSVVYAAGSAGLFKSTDGGDSWTPSYTDKAVTQVAIDPFDSQHLILLAAGTALNTSFIYSSPDGGKSWVGQGDDLLVYYVVFDPLQKGYVHLSGDLYFYSHDGGNHWTNSVYVFGILGAPAVDPFKAGTLYLATYSGVARSVDGGVTWGTISSQALRTLVASPVSRNVLYGAGLTSSLLVSMDGGISWRATVAKPPLSSLAFDPTNSTRLYILNLTGLSMTDDGGATVQSAAGAPANPAVSSLAFDVKHPGTIFATSSLGTDAFLTKVNADGSASLFSTYFGGAAADSINGIALDGAGNIYVAGTTNSADLPQAQGVLSGSTKAYAARVSNDGSALSYVRYLGGGNTDTATGIAANPAGEVVMVGSTLSADFPLTPDALQRVLATGRPTAYAMKLDSAGGVQFASYLGGTRGDLANAVAVDAKGRWCIAGDTFSPDFKATPDAVQAVHNGLVDAFLMILNFQ